jgi:hypothetical protein
MLELETTKFLDLMAKRQLKSREKLSLFLAEINLKQLKPLSLNLKCIG